MKDPIGTAIEDFFNGDLKAEIIVESDLCEDDTIPLSILCRTVEEMSELEKTALSVASGDILDVGAGCGNHALELIKKGANVTAIDISEKAVKHMIDKGINAYNINFFELKDKQFDTITFFMNGIGIAGKLSNLKHTLAHAKTLLKPNGKLIFDSSDISYLYEDEDGSVWMDLNNEYFGNFKFKMNYKNESTDWFDWLYVDYNKMKEIAEDLNFEVNLLFEEEYSYLTELTLK